MQPIFSLRNIYKRLGPEFSLDIEELDLLPHRLYSLAGPNGSGKSTLMHILALLSSPDRGTMYFAGDQVVWSERHLHEIRRYVTLVHQSPFLFGSSVAQNLAFGLKLRGVIGRKQRQRIFEALTEVGLPEFAERKATGLSGGESQRVAIARALVLEPKVLLLDEPTSNIDQKNILQFEQIIAAQVDRGMTVIMVTHDPEQSARLGGQVIALQNGRLAPA